MNLRRRTTKTRRSSSARHGRRSWSGLSRRRAAALFALGSLVWVLIFSRLFFIQVLKGAEYKNISSRQNKQYIKLEAKRGAILDRQGRELVINLPVESFFAIPESVKNTDEVARAFSSNSSAYHMLKKNLQTKENFVWLKRKVEKSETESLKKRRLQGVWAIDETKRYYLYGDLAREILGFTNIDNQGLAGIEYQYNRYLRGEDGEAVFQRDGHRNSYRIAEYPLREPEDGKSLMLTIDIELQSVVEQELSKGVELTEADGGSALFMDPKSGEILAMAYCGKDDGLPVKNRILSDNFEPGSTFKIITAGAALEEGILTAEDSIFAENGEYWIGKRSIHDVKPLKWLSFKECVVYSSNIALAKTAMMLGKERLYQYARRFGIGQKTGIDLPGEGTGFIPAPKRWPDLVLGCMGFGQGVSLTALQLVCAYSAVANGGIMMKPYAVKAILDKEGNIIQSNQPTVVGRVVSENTAHTLIDFMKGVVTSGSGQKAQMDGLTIGGKTGTAQRAKPGGGGYEEGKYIASFIGLFPAEDPQMVGLITLDNPKKEHLGGQTAAPIFKNATQKIVSLSGETILANSMSQEQPKGTEEDKSTTSRPEPDLPKMNYFDLFSQQEQFPESTILVPDVLGLTLREAVKIFSSRDLKWKLKGSGIVVNQTPKPDTLVSRDTEFLLECQPD